MATKSDWVLIKTTLPVRPLPPSSSRPSVATERLTIRALVPEDVHSLHVLRTQPEVMAFSPQGRVDRDLQETQTKMAPFLPPRNEANYEFAICFKTTGEMIGVGGCYSLASLFGWPAVGYRMRREYWGQGLATEFVRAWLDMWHRLPREEVEIRVDPRTLPGAGNENGFVLEQLTPFTLANNLASQRVLVKSGFEHFLTWTEPDLRNPDVDVTLKGFRCFPYKASTVV